VLVGHHGGDDFVYVCEASQARPIAEKIIAAFDEEILEHYDDEDRERGYMVLTDRMGNEKKHTPLTVSVVIVSTDRRTYWSPLEMADIAAELKAYAKTLDGSVVVEDRREESDGTQGDRDAGGADEAEDAQD
jgi:GGDEF domain-containing protein